MKGFRKEAFVTFVLVFFILLFSFASIYFLKSKFTSFVIYENRPSYGQTNLLLRNIGENLGDVYVKKNPPDKNSNTDELIVSGNNPGRNSYLKFNISLVPDEKIIENAELCLYLYDKAQDIIIYAHQVYSNWNESQMFWNNQPCGENFDNSSMCNLSAESYISAENFLENSWACWNVKNMVLKQYGGQKKEVSIALHSNDSNGMANFYSKEYSGNVLFHPYLNITYSTPNYAPLLQIFSPSGNYSNNPIDINFSAYDNENNIESCWYVLDSGQETLISGCHNFSINVSEGTHFLVIYANDTLGLQTSDTTDFFINIPEDNEQENNISVQINLSLINPVGNFSTHEIPVEFSAVGENLICWYDIQALGEFIFNKTFINCSNFSFTLGESGNYIFNLYANDSFGISKNASSVFSIELLNQSLIENKSQENNSANSIENPFSGGPGGGRSNLQEPVNLIADLEIGRISEINSDFGESKEIVLKVKNNGSASLTNCKLISSGKYGSWISSKDTIDLNPEDDYNFKFELNVPAVFDPERYEMFFTILCDESARPGSFWVKINDKKLGFGIIEAKRNENGLVDVSYNLEEKSGIDQTVSLKFTLFDEGNQKIAELGDSKQVVKNTKNSFVSSIPIGDEINGKMSLLININSEVYSAFVYEDIVLPPRTTGFAVFSGDRVLNGGISGIIIALFLFFGFFMLRRIVKLKRLAGRHHKKLK